MYLLRFAKTDNTQNNNKPDGRKKYARSLMIVKVGNGPSVVDATGTDNKTLFVDSTDVTEKDCSNFVKSEISQNAAKIGFNKLTCRDGLKLEEWSFPLN